MKILTFQTIRDMNISPMDCYDWVDYTLRHKGESTLPPKISLHYDGDAFFNVMPCLIPASDIAGVKVITRRVGRTPALDSQIMLYSYETLEPLALMDGNWITAMRTGAVAAHTVSQLAVESFQEIGVMGLGNTGRAAMRVLLARYPERKLDIKVLRYKDQAEAYIESFKGADGSLYPNANFEIVDKVEDVARNSDVVISAVTYQQDDFLEPGCFKPGVLVVAIHLRGFMECDLQFDRVCYDDLAHVEGFKYFSQWPSHSEMADVITGKAPGRLNDKERIIAYNVGLSLHDMKFAREVYDRAPKNGAAITLDPPTGKIWV